MPLNDRMVPSVTVSNRLPLDPGTIPALDREPLRRALWERSEGSDSADHRQVPCFHNTCSAVLPVSNRLPLDPGTIPALDREPLRRALWERSEEGSESEDHRQVSCLHNTCSAILAVSNRLPLDPGTIPALDREPLRRLSGRDQKVVKVRTADRFPAFTTHVAPAWLWHSRQPSFLC
ncbi:hypothetical protein J6590_044080 [Homalodisca vitripennis]|nr:hypothetical protein J6590_044080 [Homalodisca vitripennis]